MARLRTIGGAFREIKSNDPNTAITVYGIRKLVIEGKIPSSKSGNRWLLDLDALENYYKDGGM